MTVPHTEDGVSAGLEIERRGYARFLMNGSDPTLEMVVHHAIVRGLLDHGHAPSLATLAGSLGRADGDIAGSMRALETSHSLVLHPGRTEVWLIHPFSTSPTATWVQKGDRGWWAPCLWCGFGVATLAGGHVVIHSRLGGEAEPVRIEAVDGRPKPTDLVVHFPEPPRHAWSNVHHFCARLLPFRNGADIEEWARRHALPMGRRLSMDQLADLARRWYGGHADPKWRKHTVAEASAIFAACGLTDDFWALEVLEGVY